MQTFSQWSANLMVDLAQFGLVLLSQVRISGFAPGNVSVLMRYSALCSCEQCFMIQGFQITLLHFQTRRIVPSVTHCPWYLCMIQLRNRAVHPKVPTQVLKRVQSAKGARSHSIGMCVGSIISIIARARGLYPFNSGHGMAFRRLKRRST